MSCCEKIKTYRVLYLPFRVSRDECRCPGLYSCFHWKFQFHARLEFLACFQLQHVIFIQCIQSGLLNCKCARAASSVRYDWEGDQKAERGKENGSNKRCSQQGSE